MKMKLLTEILNLKILLFQMMSVKLQILAGRLYAKIVVRHVVELLIIPHLKYFKDRNMITQ